jgi:hypothetical protein
MDVRRFEREGFLKLDDGLLSPDLVARAAAVALESADVPAKHRAHGSSHGHFDFPFAPATAEQPLNALTLNADLHAAVGRLLSSPPGDTRLVHAGIVGATSCSDQPRTVLNSEGYVDAAAAEFSDIYAHEAFTLLPSLGSGNAVVLFVPLKVGCGVVAVQFDPQHEHEEAVTMVQELLASHTMLLRIIVRRVRADYISCDSYTSASGLSPELLAPLSVLQRALLHIPLPGHSYWTADTVAAASARYGWDPSPYCDRLSPKERANALQQVSVSDGLMSAHCTYDGGGWTRNESGVLPGTDRQTVQWEQPQQALPESAGGPVLSPEQVAEFHQYGCLAVDGIWPAEVIRDGRQALEEIYPTWEDWNRQKQEDPRITQSHDPHINQFPYSRPALNTIVLHQRILTAVTQLLGGEVRFYGDVSLAKFGTDPPSGDQELHLDFEGNMSLVPPEKANAVKCILNYSHVEDSAGGTRFVPGPEGLVTPRQLAAGRTMDADQVYPHERTIRYSPGSVLIYVNRLWHRGSPVNDRTVRYTQHFNYVRSDALWVGSHTWARALWSLEKRELLQGFTRAEFVSSLTPLQRCALGGCSRSMCSRL